jgi:hypothetical protein
LNLQVNELYQNLVPPLSIQEYEALKRSISEKGFWKSKPITINGQGIILDGYHRYQACQELKIKPVISVEIFDGDGGLQEKLFVIESNLRRRQLNKFQRTELALKEKPILEEIARRNSQANLKQTSSKPIPSVGYQTVGKGRVDQQIADRAGVGKDAVREVEFILDKAPEKLIDRLRRGVSSASLTIHTVYKRLHNEQVRQELVRNARPIIQFPNDMKLIQDDFRSEEATKEIPDNSIDLIFTDPPYAKESLYLYKDVAIAANRILKPGGALVVYANQLYLPKIIFDILDTGLTWWWELAIKYVHRGTKPVYDRLMFYRWKPLLYFIKGDKQAEGVKFMSDLIEKKIPLNKELHDWA